LRESSPDFDLSQTSDMANQANRFSSVLEQMLNRERQNSRVRGMIFSDCAFIDLGTPYQTASIASELMRILIHARLPVRMGIGRGTFYAEQFGTTVVGTSVFAKNIFFGTGVVRAYAAEPACGSSLTVRL
jgi:hypothetical protein